MSAGEVVIVRTGAANLASVVAAFERLDRAPVVTADPVLVGAAERVVLPGVGAFAPVAEALSASGLGDAISDRVRAGRATLGICLGLQLLAERSEEGAGVAGLGLLEAEVRCFPATVVVPQLGWNRVAAGAGCRLLSDGAAYFANSYRIAEPPPGWAVATADHGGPFVAAVERGAVLGCQFHPELSGAWGAELLRRWLEVEEVTPC